MPDATNSVVRETPSASHLLNDYISDDVSGRIISRPENVRRGNPVMRERKEHYATNEGLYMRATNIGTRTDVKHKEVKQFKSGDLL